MIKEEDRREILAAVKVVRKAETMLENSRANLKLSLEKARENGASYNELGELIGVSRQRVHQVIGT